MKNYKRPQIEITDLEEIMITSGGLPTEEKAALQGAAVSFDTSWEGLLNE